MLNLQACKNSKAPKKNTSIWLDKALELIDKQTEFVRWQMQAGQNTATCPLLQLPPKHGNLQWTGSVVEWVELIYALYSVKRINNGKISLKELFLQLGEVFDFEVKEFANYFMNIKSRTNGRRTKFMDLLKDAVLGRMDNADRKLSQK
jgi:hypothetical protein